MSSRFRHRLSAEEGLGLVEVLAAFTVLAIVFSASAQAVATTLRSQESAERRTKAVALANEVLEQMRVLDWHQLGFYSAELVDASGNPLTAPAGTIILGGGRPAGSRAPRIEDVRTRDGLPYRVRRTITRVGTNDDARQLRVRVTWDNRGTPQTVTAETVRSRIRHDIAAADFQLSQVEVLPFTGSGPSGTEYIYLNGSGFLDPARNTRLQLSALTNERADFVTISYEELTGPRGPVPLSGSADGRTWTGSLFNGSFANGDANFLFTATRALPYEQIVFGTKLVRFAWPLAVRSVTVTPASACIAPTAPAPPVTVRVDLQGLVVNEPVMLTAAGQEVRLTAAGVTDRSTVFQGTLPPGSYEASGTTFTFSGRRGDGGVISGSGQFQLVRSEACP